MINTIENARQHGVRAINLITQIIKDKVEPVVYLVEYCEQQPLEINVIPLCNINHYRYEMFDYGDRYTISLVVNNIRVGVSTDESIKKLGDDNNYFFLEGRWWHKEIFPTE